MRMLQKPSSCVLASLKASTYQPYVRLGLSLAAALPEELFQHPLVHRRFINE